MKPDYRTALDFLYSFIDYERDPGWKYDDSHFDLKRVRDFLESLGNPHRHGWFVHIAGTNGKGSVAAMLANALNGAGLRTGLYTSPHLIDFRERIRFNGRMITPGELIECVGRIRELTGSFQGLTFFEVWTALAFDYFARKAVDVSVIEAGMGGRLDATNVVTPAVSVITSISMDHAGILGETPAEIAGEKAGIIKNGIPVVSAPQTPDVLEVIERKAEEAEAELTVVGRDVTYKEYHSGISYSGLKWSFDEVAVPLGGAMQYENAAVALAALETLSIKGYNIDPSVALGGIETVRWPGRLETISTKPEVIVDGACNTMAMRGVCEFLSLRSTRDETVAVVAMCRDKEIKRVLGIIGECASRFVLTQVDNPRAVKAEKLAEMAPGNVSVVVEPDNKKAVREAVSLAGKNGMVIITGSLYLVGEAFKMYGIEKIEKI